MIVPSYHVNKLLKMKVGANVQHNKISNKIKMKNVIQNAAKMKKKIKIIKFLK